jgi:hypothetical protein
VISELRRRKLINVREPGEVYAEESYTVPKLIKNRLLLDMEGHVFLDAFRNSFRLARKVFPFADPQQVPRPVTFEACERYLPHVLSLHEIFVNKSISTSSLVDPKPLEVAELFYDAAFYVWAQGTTGYTSALFLDTAKRLLDDIEIEPDAKIRADILCIDGLELLDAGCVERARAAEVLLQAWELRNVIYEKTPNMDNDVLKENAACDYALALLDDHRFDEAGDIFKKNRERYLMWGVEDKNPFEFSKYYGNYSIILMMEGKLDEAVAYARKSAELTLKFHGVKGPVYYERLFTLACMLLQKGDLQEALDVHLEVLAARMGLLGKHHAFTILSIYAVGTVYDSLGYDKWAT